MRIVGIIPCLNEEQSIRSVIYGLRQQLPQASIYVFDNGSVDQTNHLSRAAGAEVIEASQFKGKGGVLRHALSLLQADFFVIVDGDGTYSLEKLPQMLACFESGADMVIGVRKYKKGSLQIVRWLGNKFFTRFVNWSFSCQLNDLLSGFRILSRECVTSLRLSSEGFEIETEMTLQAVLNGQKIEEVDIDYYPRVNRSGSKLSPLHDGFKIFRQIYRQWKMS